MPLSEWLYNEFQQTGTDYADADQVAIYDETHADFRDVAAEFNRALDALDVAPGQTIVDFGAGTGDFALLAAGRGLSVVAVDISRAMLDAGRAKAERAGVEGGGDRVRFVHSGFLNYQHEGPPADFVHTSYALHHLPDFWKGLALQNIRGALAPHGRLFLQDVIITEDNAVENINAFIASQHVSGGDFLRDDAIEHFKAEYSTYDWIMEELLARNGFAVESKSTQFGLIAQYLCSAS
ncbi:MAG: class I SAM-dependent methyltransferase [Planctomycetota bacterium]|jgi:ubiquinone/menaquinone biosynthesis C-methylase UbiE